MENKYALESLDKSISELKKLSATYALDAKNGYNNMFHINNRVIQDIINITTATEKAAREIMLYALNEIIMDVKINNTRILQRVDNLNLSFAPSFNMNYIPNSVLLLDPNVTFSFDTRASFTQNYDKLMESYKNILNIKENIIRQTFEAREKLNKDLPDINNALNKYSGTYSIRLSGNELTIVSLTHTVTGRTRDLYFIYANYDEEIKTEIIKKATEYLEMQTKVPEENLEENINAIVEKNSFPTIRIKDLQLNRAIENWDFSKNEINPNIRIKDTKIRNMLEKDLLEAFYKIRMLYDFNELIYINDIRIGKSFLIKLGETSVPNFGTYTLYKIRKGTNAIKLVIVDSYGKCLVGKQEKRVKGALIKMGVIK